MVDANVDDLVEYFLDEVKESQQLEFSFAGDPLEFDSDGEAGDEEDELNDLFNYICKNPKFYCQATWRNLQALICGSVAEIK